MPPRSLRAQVVGALEFRARALLGPDAAPIQYAEAWVAAGLSLTALARAIAADLSYPVSRGFVSFTCQRLLPDARQRIKAARQKGRGASITALVADLIPAHATPARRHDKATSAIVFRDPPQPSATLVFREPDTDV